MAVFNRVLAVDTINTREEADWVSLSVVGYFVGKGLDPF